MCVCWGGGVVTCSMNVECRSEYLNVLFLDCESICLCVCVGGGGGGGSYVL